MRRRVLISGRVQGVGFRWAAAEAARGLGLRGAVRNLRDGRVEAVLDGDPAAVDEMVGWLHHGPPTATVESVEVEELPEVSDPVEGFHLF